MIRVRDLLKNTIIKEECANSASGCGIRGLGNVTGDPRMTDDLNPHFQRMAIDSEINNNNVQTWIKNNTQGLYSFDDDDWWEDRKGMKKRIMANTKKSRIIKEGMEKDHYKAIDDVHVNLDNRNHAIEDYGYGPLNPNEDSTKFWKEKADLWETSVDEAKKSRCGNCAAFNKSKEILERIAENLGPAGKTITEKADLGFCEMFHFKCAAARTCDAWLMNGPITEEIANATGPAVNPAIPGTGDDPQAFPRADNKYKKQNEKDSSAIMRRLQTGVFAGNKTFKVPSDVFNLARLQKAHGQHWKTYLNRNEFHPEIRDFANKSKGPIIFEDEKTGYMFYARYGKKAK